MKLYLTSPSGKLHEKNISRERYNELRKDGWRLATPQERQKWLAENKDRLLYGELPDGYQTMIDVHFITPKNPYDGYGTTGRQIAGYLKKKGVYLNPYFNNQKIGLAYHYPYMVKQLRTEKKIIYTMFESDRMPDDWQECFDMADLVLTPSEFCAEVMRRQFCINPIVVPLGIEPNNYHFVERKRKKTDPFTLLHYDAFKWRKGWDLVLNAFEAEFGNSNPDVKLIFKTVNGTTLPMHEYPRVEVVKGRMGFEEMRKLHQRSDVFVFPSRGEGFGLTPLEAMATGSMPIVTNAHGIADYFNPALMIGLKSEPVKSQYDNPHFVHFDLGNFVEPRVRDLRIAMRKAYEMHQSGQLAKMSKEISKHAMNWTIEKTADQLKDIVEGMIEPKQRNQYLVKGNTMPSERSVVFFIQNVNHFTGGMYYSWQLAYALTEAGFEVFVYTDKKPLFLKEFDKYTQPRIVEVRSQDQIAQVDVPAMMYWGAPVAGAIRACELAKKHNKRAFVQIYDPEPMRDKYLGKLGHASHWDDLISLMKHENVNIISLCQTANPYIEKWLDKKPEQVIEIYPSVNDIERDETQEKLPKQNWVTLISRLDTHKNVHHVLEAVQKTDCDLQIITNVDHVEINKLLNQYGMLNRTIIHNGISDQEKFEIIKQSKVTINASTFEGFGMWLIESLACGVPVVCYDYPIFREIAKEADPIIYFAKYGDRHDLSAKLEQALSEGKRGKQENFFSFKTMVGRIKHIFKKHPRIGVVMCALNEQKFIEASLKSVLKHPSIARVVVVEGAVQLFKHRASKKGLSVDETSQILTRLEAQNRLKMKYVAHGWAENKAELRNIALDHIGNTCDYILVVDGDEVWKPEDLDKLTELIKNNPDISMVDFHTHHFWHDFDTLAVGGQWDLPLIRFFKFEDKQTRWDKHHLPPINSDGFSVAEMGRRVWQKDIVFYHYGYVKDEADVQAKLEFYKKRDKDLNVVDTWTGWKPGDPTQPTHGGGSYKKFKGEHPEEIAERFLK